MQKKLILLILGCYAVLMGTAFFRPLVIQRIMDKGLLGENLQVVIIFAVVLFALVFVEEGISILQAKLFIELKNKVVIRLYTKGFAQLIKAKMNYFAENNTTEIINRLSTDINHISSLFDNGMMHILSYVLKIICGITGLVIVNWKLAILVLTAVPIKYLMIRFFSEKKEGGIRQWIEENSKFSAWFDDNISGIREIKLWNQYKNKQETLKQRQRNILDLEKKNALIDEYNLAGDSLLQGIVLSILYGAGGYFVCRDNLSIGSLTAFITYSNYVINPISLVMNVKLIFAEINPSFERLKDFLSFETEYFSKDGYSIHEFRDSIFFKDVSFSYDEKVLMKNISFEIHKGEKIAITGENGSGKSTLIGLLLRFLCPDEGNIFIDGRKANEYQLKDYRELFGVVSQETYLFRDTLKNNIKMNRKIDDEKLRQMCEKMEIQDLVDKLPNGYDSVLDKNGENLSGGERQKIALIRAIIKDSPIIIMDEATANIDKKYSEFFYRRIISEFPEKTFVIITHKTEYLEEMDAVYEIRDHTLLKVTNQG